MKNRSGGAHSISGVFVFLLLGLFALFATVMVVLGVGAYRGTVDRAGVRSNERIAAAYLRSKLRAADEAGALRPETIEGYVSDEDGNLSSVGPVETLAIGHTYRYVTRYYVYNGRLFRGLWDVNDAFHPEDGEPLCYVKMPEESDPSPGFHTDRDGDTLKVSVWVDTEYSLLGCETVDGIDTAVIRGYGYDDRLYVYDGSLMRQSAEEGAFDPAEGERLCEARSLTADFDKGILRLTIDADPEIIQSEKIDGITVVAIHHPEETAEDRVARLYVWDGMLMECEPEADEPFDPSLGEPVCEALAMSVERVDSLITVRLQLPSEEWLEFHYALRAAGE